MEARLDPTNELLERIVNLELAGQSRADRDRRTDHPQSFATSSASQTSRIRAPLSEPIRSTSTATDTDSTESRFTTLRWLIGSLSGSRTTSLGRPRMVVVQGAINARRNLGIAASRDNTTTGRRPISGGSHHQSSPRFGSVFTWPQPHCGTSPDCPIRLRRRSDGLDRQLRRRR